MKYQNWNEGWKFVEPGHPQDGQTLHLPHDAMIGRARIPRLKNGSLTGYYPSGDSDYYKTFYGSTEWADKTVIVEFEGVYMDCTVSLNGEAVGGRIYGYSNFFVELTDKIRIGEENILHVHTHCSQVPNSRWYPGNGIYRPVKLWIGEREHIVPDGIRVCTVSYEPAVVTITTQAVHDDDCQLKLSVWDGDHMVASVNGWECTLQIPNAKLWSAENPALYHVRAELMRGDLVIDRAETDMGICHIETVPGKGLLINGIQTKLQGGCLHHDHGILGAAAFRAAAWRRIRLLKEAGFNAIRSSHYPLDKDTLEACDHLGMYVMDESFDTWRDNVGTYGYVLDFDSQWRMDTESMIRKDWNHPCVIMYSIGNEISDTAKDYGVELTKEMVELIKRLDTSRPVTVCPNLLMNAMNRMGIQMSLNGGEFHKKDVTDPLEQDKDSKMGGSVLINIMMAAAPAIMKLMLTPKRSDEGTKDCYAHVDIAGYNYGEPVYEAHTQMHPDRIIVGSETNPPQISRNWEWVKRFPNVIGDFMWTAWDYLGEAGVGAIDYGKNLGNYNKPYPIVSAYTGAFDLIGHKDTNGHLASVVWGAEKDPYIAVRPVNHAKEKCYVSGYRGTDAIHSWTFPGYEGAKTQVQVYSPGASLELLQNGKSLGKKKIKLHRAFFDVRYFPGELKAISYDDQGKILGQSVLRTASGETVLQVSCDRQTLLAVWWRCGRMAEGSHHLRRDLPGHADHLFCVYERDAPDHHRYEQSLRQRMERSCPQF